MKCRWSNLLYVGSAVGPQSQSGLYFVAFAEDRKVIESIQVWQKMKDNVCLVSHDFQDLVHDQLRIHNLRTPTKVSLSTCFFSNATIAIIETIPSERKFLVIIAIVAWSICGPQEPQSL